ncbi:MAG: spermidine synthase [Betaproteobacteria bacterium]|jgi:hypothetical protein
MFLFAATIVLSAFLLFLVQPIVAKQILAWFGGTSAVWTTCMVFFQVVLLAGYAYAHGTTRWLTPRTQSRVHIALLLASLAFLPIIPSAALKPAPGADAAGAILLLLAATIGLPYFLLSSTGPLLQKWVAHRLPEKTVYRLFALSNAGSLAGLLAFPFAIEPFADSRTQSWAWSGAYALFVFACAASAWMAQRAAADAAGDAVPLVGTPRAAADTGPAPTAADYLLWLALAALGSVLLLAATSHITQNIASAPFLWVVPLALYLLTFIVVFEGRGGRGWYDTRWGTLLAVGAAALMASGLTANNAVLDISLAVPLYALGMFATCLFCHGELAARKPSPAYLTQFYLTLSAGGAAGGLFVALAAPHLFNAYYELPLALVAVCALAVWLAWRNRALHGPTVVSLALTSLVALGVTGYLAWDYAKFLRSNAIVMERNFYGTLRVKEGGIGEAQLRRLLHGVILHGEQYMQGARRTEPGSYYSPTSGIGVAVLAKQQRGPVRVGVVGLGTGTLAAYGRAGDTIRYYELDPDVLALARSHFGYLNETPATMEYALGDARLSLERELVAGQPGRFDVLAIDAFSSDSIPVHLITREAIALHMQHLAPDGILAIHISNRFLDLKPVLANIAQAEGLVVRNLADVPNDPAASSTDWVLIARDPKVFAEGDLAARTEPLEPKPEFSLWTDQFNNLLDVLKSRPVEELKRLLGGG